MKPNEIEIKSFAIIDNEVGDHQFINEEWQIVRRMIHTTADFEYKKNTYFHPKAIKNGILAIQNGKTIITDTNMARMGIRKRDLIRFDAQVDCLIEDPVVMQTAQNQEKTRAHVAIDMAVSKYPDGIYVIGNAPTALLRLIELIQNGAAKPALVIGLPVGFVNATESKAALQELDQPYITNIGRKGGSNVAASVVNALILLAINIQKSLI